MTNTTLTLLRQLKLTGMADALTMHAANLDPTQVVLTAL